MTIERKLAPVVSDGVSAEEIEQTVASDAAGALEKVTGVSVVDNGYVYVRGLGERYSATMLNNAILPTTEPERRVVPLDLFPASLIDNIKVLKSYSPDLPGEFSAGLVQSAHNRVSRPPRSLKISLSQGFNSLTTFKSFQSYPGGKHDFFGFDDGTRSIPSAVPATSICLPGNFTQAEFQQLGRSFPVNWEPTTLSSMRPSQGFSLSAGNTFRAPRTGWRVDVFELAFAAHGWLRTYYRISGTKPIPFTDYPDFQVPTNRSGIGGVGQRRIPSVRHRTNWSYGTR